MPQDTSLNFVNKTWGNETRGKSRTSFFHQKINTMYFHSIVL